MTYTPTYTSTLVHDLFVYEIYNTKIPKLATEMQSRIWYTVKSLI